MSRLLRKGLQSTFDSTPFLSCLIVTHVCTESQAQHRPLHHHTPVKQIGWHAQKRQQHVLHSKLDTNTALFRHTHYPLKRNASLYFCCSFGLLLCSSFFASLNPSLGLLSSFPVEHSPSTLLSSNSLFCLCLGVFLLACSSVLLHQPHVHAIKHQALQ